MEHLHHSFKHLHHETWYCSCKCYFNRACIFIDNSVILNLVQPKSHPFPGASLDSVITNIDNLKTWGVKLNVPHQNLIKVLMMF